MAALPWWGVRPLLRPRQLPRALRLESLPPAPRRPLRVPRPRTSRRELASPGRLLLVRVLLERLLLGYEQSR
jgi:hypothetical protein